jgi:hypothetical protein
MNYDANERAKTSVRTLGNHRIARFALALSLPLKYTFPTFPISVISLFDIFIPITACATDPLFRFSKSVNM